MKNMYRAGDYVYPNDLPRRWLCRVTKAESAEACGREFQILTLEPLEGPWRASPDTRVIIRFGEDVLTPRARDLWTLAGDLP